MGAISRCGIPRARRFRTRGASFRDTRGCKFDIRTRIAACLLLECQASACKVIRALGIERQLALSLQRPRRKRAVSDKRVQLAFAWLPCEPRGIIRINAGDCGDPARQTSGETDTVGRRKRR